MQGNAGGGERAHVQVAEKSRARAARSGRECAAGRQALAEARLRRLDEGEAAARRLQTLTDSLPTALVCQHCGVASPTQWDLLCHVRIEH